eukprot:scaffold176756_cov33-Tisochrysis_lutea.AAC.4
MLVDWFDCCVDSIDSQLVTRDCCYLHALVEQCNDARTRGTCNYASAHACCFLCLAKRSPPGC